MAIVRVSRTRSTSLRRAPWRACVLVASIVTLVLSVTAGHAWLWITAALAYGFIARVLTGPTLSPLGSIAMKVIAPRLGEPRVRWPARRSGSRRASARSSRSRR